MPPAVGRFVRENVFLVAAVALPLVVIGFFLAASAIPRWTVPPPAYDLVFRAGGPYDQAPRVSVEYHVRDDAVHVTVRPVDANAYPQRSTLFLVDHRTLALREIPVNLPALVGEGGAATTAVVDALAGRRVIAEVQAPDGYRLEMRTRRGPGLVGELFGMHRYDQNVVLSNRGRVIPLALPAPHQYLGPVQAVGWLADEGGR
jgi:hypothetical protein